MKSIKYIVAFFLLAQVPLSGQALFAAFHSGYHRKNYDGLEGYTNSNAIPVAVQAGFGTTNMQIGLEYASNLAHPSFVYYDPHDRNERFREIFKERYTGLLLRFNTASDMENMGVTFKTGMGVLWGNRQTRLIGQADIVDKQKFNASLSFYGATGLVFPLAPNLQFSTELILGTTTRKTAGGNDLNFATYKFKTTTLGLNIGLVIYLDEF